MSISMFAEKIGMSQIFIEFKRVPVTILKINDNIVLDKIHYDVNNKYVLKLGYKTAKKTNRSLEGYFNKKKIEPSKHIKELKVSQSIFDNAKIGDNLNLNSLKEYKYLKVSGQSIGKGFAGVMKRHNFKGFPASHGTHEMFRHGGSIGCRTKPGKVFKGKKMPGHMGNQRKTIINIEIVKRLYDDNILLVKGSVPGHRNALVFLTGYNT